LEKRAANMRIIIKWIITKRIGLCGLDSCHRFICFWVWTSSGLLSTLMIGSQRDQEISLFSKAPSPTLMHNTPILNYWRLLLWH
jgi:hypothetical protein